MQEDTSLPATSKTTFFDAPTDKDVLCGRGKPIQYHPGNRRFLEIVNEYREQYQTASSRAEKKRITYKVMGIVEESGGRFLQLDPAARKYYDVGEEQARDKVSHALRNRKIDTSSSTTAVPRNRTSASQTSVNGNNTQQQQTLTQEDVAHHGVLLSKQQQIFQALVNSDQQFEAAFVQHDGRDMAGTTNAGGRLQEEDEAATGGENVVDTLTFDELLRRQKLIFENLVIHDDGTPGSGGGGNGSSDNGPMVNMAGAPIHMSNQ